MAMECFFIEWFGTSEVNPWGRQPVSNATQAIERASKEGGVGLHTLFLRQHCCIMARKDNYTASFGSVPFCLQASFSHLW